MLLSLCGCVGTTINRPTGQEAGTSPGAADAGAADAGHDVQVAGPDIAVETGVRTPDTGAESSGGPDSVATNPPRGADASSDSGPQSDAAPTGPPGSCIPGGNGLDTGVPGVALDGATCLAWQRDDPPKDKGSCLIAADSNAKLCFDEAVTYCRSLRLDGKTDWRLPTVDELTTIVVAQGYPAIDRTVFPDTLLSFYWTSVRNGDKVVCLDFSNAGTPNDHVGPDGPQAVRCVRSAR
jgi:Protein of unknown function (DUF1566)